MTRSVSSQGFNDLFHSVIIDVSELMLLKQLLCMLVSRTAFAIYHRYVFYFHPPNGVLNYGSASDFVLYTIGEF